MLVESGGTKHAAWRRAVSAEAVKQQGDRPPLEGALQASLTFHLVKPKTRTTPPISKPDLDKLARAVLDSLSKIVYHDDAQITNLRAQKKWANGIGEGVTILIAPAELPNVETESP